MVSDKKNIFEDNSSPFGYAYHKIIKDAKGSPIDYVFLDVNSSFEKLTGLKRENILDKSIKEVLPDIEKSEFDWIGFYGNTAINGGNETFEQFSEVLDKWYSVHVYSNKKDHFTTVFTDITEEKEKRRELEDFFDVNLDLLCIADINGYFRKLNKEWESLLGYSIDELLGKCFLDFVHPEDLQATMNTLLNLATQEKVLNFVNRYRCKDGSYKYIEWRSNPRGNLIYAAARDITEHKQAETYNHLTLKILNILNRAEDFKSSVNDILTLLKSEIKCDAIGLRLNDKGDFPYLMQSGFSKDFLLTENSIIVKNEKGGICRDEEGNPILECTCGLVISGQTDPTNPMFTEGGSCWVNDSFPVLDIPETDDPRLHPRNNCIHNGYGSIALIPIKKKDTIVGLLQLNFFAVNQLNLKIVRYLENIANHIGEALLRLQVEEELKISETKYKKLFEILPVGITVSDEVGNIIESNKVAERILGLSSEEQTKRKIDGQEWRIINKDGSAMQPEQYASSIALKENRLVENVEMGIVKGHENDDISWINVSATPMNIKGYGVAIAYNDITDRKIYEDKLAEQKQLLEEWNQNLEQQIKEEVEKSRLKDELMIVQSRQAAMGEMIGNIAHQWRQPLNAISLIVYDIYDSYKHDEITTEYMSKCNNDLQQLAQHMSHTIDDFKDFFRPIKEETLFCLNDVIKKAISFVSISFQGKNININLKEEKQLMSVGYPNEYAQVVINILNNAKDAIVENKVKKGEIVIVIEQLDNNSICRISDNGGGIAKDILHKIFDPYFTTKDDKQGSGIGLYMSKIIIEKNMDGKLNVRNINKGAEFELIIKNT